MFFSAAWQRRIIVLLTAAALCGSGCRSTDTNLERRIAIVYFDDLTSGGSSRWAGAALAEVVAARFNADRDAAFAVPNLQEARLRHPTHTVQGYLSRPDQLKLTIRDEQAQNNDEFLVLPFVGPLQSAEPLVRELGGSPRPYTTANAKALEARWQSEIAVDLEHAAGYARNALTLDPQYGAAHLQNIEVALRSGDAAAVRAAMEAASVPNVRYTTEEMARLNAHRARLNSDERLAASASVAFARARRSDPAAWLVAAQQLLIAKQAGEAAVAIGQAIRYQPADAPLWNQLGYAQAFAGNLRQATQSLRRYAELQPRSPNPLDSLGEIHFLFKQFDQAEAFFLQAAEVDPNFLGGQLFLRAALSSFLAGDRAKADQHYKTFERYLAERKDPLIAVRAAMWLNATGRGEDARSHLENVLKQPDLPAAVRVAALSVRSLWLSSAGDRAGAAAAARQALQSAGPANRILPSTAAFLASPSAAPPVWEQRAQQAIPAGELEPLRDKLLAWALLLDGHEAESGAVWDRVWERTSLLGGAEESAAYSLALARAGKLESGRRKVPPLLPLPVTDPGWTALLFPEVISATEQPPLPAKD